MNGRVYDPLTAQFFSPDPYVQAPDNWLNYNRYAYAYGNPFKYTDPSGEWIHLVIGAVIGGTINWLANRAEFTWKGLAYFGVGALAGVAGGLTGQAVAGIVGTVGFAGGAMNGIAAGLTGGFVGGAGNAWSKGASFGQGLKQGFIGGGLGAITGGLIGGISGGITAIKHGGNFWSGKGATFDALATPISGDKIEVGEGMDYTNKYAQSFSDENFGRNITGVNKLYSDGSLPKGYLTKGDVVLNVKGEAVRGTTLYLGTGKGSNVYLYKAAFTSKEMLYLTMGHEYLHAGYFSAGLMNTKSQHASIHKWEAYQAKAWGLNEVAYFARKYASYKPYYSSVYDYSKLGFFILNIRPW